MTVTSRSEDSSPEDLCAVALVMCGHWLEKHAPQASVRCEVAEGEYQDIPLLRAVDKALEEMRDKNRGLR